MRTAESRAALRIVLLYAVLVALWDVLTDLWATATITDLPRLTPLLIAKDWGFGIITAALLYWILRREFHALKQAETMRLVSEQALHESEERYRSIVTAMEEGIVLQDAQGVIWTCNASAERILGLSTDQMMGRTLVDPRWRAIREDGSPFPGEAHPAMITLRTGQPLSNIIMGVHKPDGTLTWISINSQPLFRAGETRPYAVVTSFTDITEHRQAEHALRASEERYRAIYGNSTEGILLTEPGGGILAANPAACRIFGRTEEEICRIGREGVVDLSDPRLAVVLEERRRTGGFRSELTLIRQDGTRFPAEVSSSVFKDTDGSLRTSMIVRDITQPKQAQDALQERELQYRSIFESTADGLIINSFDGRIVEANPAACRMNGYSYDEFLRLEPMSIIHPDYRHLFDEFLQTVHAGGQFEAQAMNVRKDGTQFDVQVRGTQFIYKGEPHVLGIVRDITEQVRAYQLLEQRVQERTRELSTLLDISRTVASTLELEPLLELILDQLQVMVDYTSASLFTLQDDTLVMVAYRGPEPTEAALQSRIPLSDPILREAMLGRLEPVFIPDVSADEPAAQSLLYIIREHLAIPVDDVQAAMWIPLIVKRHVIGGLGVTHSKAGTFTERHANLALTIAHQAAIEIENARLYEQAQGLATLQERQRLARELHDSVTQSLYSLTLMAEAARRLIMAGDWERAQNYLGRLGQTAQQSLKEMRLLVYELRPPELAKEGLVGALQQRLDTVEGRAGVESRLFVEGDVQLPPAVEEGLYRIAQEALNNALKHAAATSVTVLIRAEADHVELQVTDNGHSFDPDALSDKGGLGLVNMQERATSLKGTLAVTSSPGQGTTVKAQIPTSSHP